MHSEHVLVKNARFVVQPAGRDRVRATRRKTVHAGIRGELVTNPFEAATLMESVGTKTAYYNPYTTDSFVGVNGEKLDTAAVVLLTSVDGKPRVFFS